MIEGVKRLTALFRCVIDNLIGFDRRTPRPYFMVVEPTHRCNARCSYCDSWKTPGIRQREELSLEEHLRILREAKDLGVRMVSYTGGEPLLRTDLQEMAAAAKELGMRTLLNTNGYLVTPENVDGILVAFDSVTVSIDSVNAAMMEERRGQRESLEWSHRALDLLLSKRQRGNQVRVNAVVDEQNAPFLEDLAGHLRLYSVPLLLQPRHSAGIFERTKPLVQVSKVSEWHADLKHLAGRRGGLSRAEGFFLKPFYAGIGKYLKGDPPWFRCFAGSFSFQLSPYGDVMVCQTERKSEGNVRTQSLSTIWQGMTERRRHISSNERGCTCWLLCTTLNYLQADRADRWMRKVRLGSLLSRANRTWRSSWRTASTPKLPR